ncbi:MAG: hypothetical protein HQK74_11575 [Desulfamplus sp.]|nr:hypothetical protein [Desulfamplus sp.]
MLITNKEYDKMIENYNFEDMPKIISEIRDDIIDKFTNHSTPSEDKLVATRSNSKSLEFASEFWGNY